MVGVWTDPEIERRGDELAQAIKHEAAHSSNEIELRLAVTPLIEAVGREMGINLERRHDRLVGRGDRPDSRYGRVIIEYERPRILRAHNSAAANRKTLEQLKGQLDAVIREEGVARDRLLGVCMDGDLIIFARYRRGTWEPQDPLHVGKASIAHLLFCLKSLQHKALTPDNLVEDFGAAPDKVSGQFVRELYKVLAASNSPKVEALFSQWRLLFSEVVGYELGSPKLDAKTLADSYGVRARNLEATSIFFCVHTYYATLIKLLAAEIVTFYGAALLPSYLGMLEALPDDRLSSELAILEEGGIFRQTGVRNFLEGDFFAWYLEVWGPDLAGTVRGIVRALRSYDPGTVRVEPDETRDLLKKLYQRLLPKKLRHGLGEYYTPDWLAELVLDEIGYDGDLSKRLLDPSCGSGTFLVLAIQRAREWAREKFLGETDTLERILNSIVGFDLNPLAVITARTNYLIALARDAQGGLLRHRRGEIEIPVYLCDAVLTPAEPQQTTLAGRRISLETVVGTFEIPVPLATQEGISSLAVALEQAVRERYRPNEFLALARRELQLGAEEFADVAAGLTSLYSTLRRVDSEKRNGIWARIIKNFFAPVFAGRFQYVAGNPPWINWESLPDQYRKNTQRLWSNYGLFNLKGWGARMGGGKKDLSALFLYLAADKYLEDQGQLGFVITQTLFKSSGAGQGFRHFRLAGTPGLPKLQVKRVHDLVEVKPFEGAANRTAVVVVRKGRPTIYPVPYSVWRRKRGEALADDMTLAEARKALTEQDHVAHPIGGRAGAPWITGASGVLKVAEKVQGRSPYKAHAGLFVGGASSVYWVRVLRKLPGEQALIENLHEEGKNRAIKEKGTVKKAVEEELLFPLIRGRDVQAWCHEASAAFLLPHDPQNGEVYPVGVLKSRFQKAYGYLNLFRKELLDRKAVQYKDVLREKRKPFYWICNVVVKKQTPALAPHKVVWREQAQEFTAAAVLAGKGKKVPIPNHKLMVVATGSSEEALYLAGLLNSTPAKFVVGSYVVSVQTSTHVLEHIKIPKFDPANRLHGRIVELSRRAHDAAAHGQVDQVRQIESEIDVAAAEFWGLSAPELKAIREALVARRGSGRRARVSAGAVLPG